MWAQVEALGTDARLFARARLAVVGPGTADALGAHGLRADLVPDRYTTAGLAAALCEGRAPGRVLLPRADLATPVLARTLADAGWSVDDVEAYRTVAVDALPPAVVARLDAGEVDVLAFASSSTVRNFVALAGGATPGAAVASIGPVTSATCRELGLTVAAEAEPSDLDGLVAAVAAAAGRAG